MKSIVGWVIIAQLLGLAALAIVHWEVVQVSTSVETFIGAQTQFNIAQTEFDKEQTALDNAATAVPCPTTRQ